MGARIYLYHVLDALRVVENRPRAVVDSKAPVLLKWIPIPPSLNAAFKNIRMKGKTGRALTTDALQWQREANLWAMQNLEPLVRLRDLAGLNIPLSFEAAFHWPNSAVWTKDGKPKPLDPPNFLKLLQDQIAEYAQMNDTLFFRTVCDKLISPGDVRYVDVTISVR